MKKSIFKKLGGLFLGLAMGLGVAVGVTAGNKTSEVSAADSYLEITHKNFTEITANYTTTFTHKYTVGGTDVNVSAYGVYKNSNGIQMNKGKSTEIYNKDAMPGNITKIECTFTATGKNSPTLYVGATSKAKDKNLGKGSSSSLTQTYTPEAGSSYKYFYFDGTTVTGACYLSSFKIYYSSGFDVTYNANKPSVATGSVTGMPSSVTSVSSHTVSSTKPTLSGYKFDGWATSDSGAVVYTGGETLSAAATLYAHWTAKTALTLTAADVNMKLGDSDKSVEVKAGGSTVSEGYTLASGNTNVISIVNNQLHVVGRGDATITITKAEDANNTYTSGTFNVHVDYADITSFELDYIEGTLGKGGEATLPGVTILPANANQGYSWSDAVATEGIIFTYNHSTHELAIDANNTVEGTIQFTATATGDSSKTATVVYTVQAAQIAHITGVTASATGTIVAKQYVGDAFDAQGFSFAPTWSEGEHDVVEITANDISWNALVAGSNPTGTYLCADGDFTVTITGVTVVNDTLVSIAFAEGCDMTKKSYNVGDSWDFSGLSIIGTMDSGKTAPAITSSNVTFSSDDAVATTTDSITVTASYQGLTATKVISGIVVQELTMDSLTINYTGGQPVLGTDFTFAGSITANMSNGTHPTVNLSDVNIGSVDKFTTNQQTITVTHKNTGATGTFNVTYKAAQYLGPAPVPANTILFNEPFTGFSKDAKPGTSNSSTTVYGGGSVTYTCEVSTTKIYEEALAGGTSPELLVAKNGGSFKMAGLPTGSAKVLSFTYACNNTNNEASCSSTAYTMEGSSGSYTLTLKDNTTAPATIDITISNSKSGNTRIDNIQLKITTPADRQVSDEKHAIRIADVTCSKSPLIAGETISKSDFKIQVQYDTGTALTSNIVPTSVSPTTLVAGTHDYTITYTGSYNDTVTKVIQLTAKAPAVLDSITITKDAGCDDVFTRNDTFTHNGIHVIAHYTDSTAYPDADVTANADITPPSDMDVAGTKTINVSYKENNVTKTTSYQITVNPIVSTYLTLSGEGIEGSNGVYTLKSGVVNEVQLTIDKDGDEEIRVTNPTAFLSFDKTSSILTVNSQTTTNESGTITFTAGSLTASLTVNVSAAEGIQNIGDNEIIAYVGSSFSYDINIQLNNVESATWTLPEGDFVITTTTRDNTGLVGTIYFTDEVSDTLTFSALTGKGKTLSVEIEVLAVNDKIKSISASLKSGVTYTAGQGQTFSKDDLTVTFVRDSGARGTLASNEFTVSGLPEGSFNRVASYPLTITSVENTKATDSLTINVGMPAGENLVTVSQEDVPGETKLEETPHTIEYTTNSLYGHDDKKNKYICEDDDLVWTQIQANKTYGALLNGSSSIEKTNLVSGKLGYLEISFDATSEGSDFTFTLTGYSDTSLTTITATVNKSADVNSKAISLVLNPTSNDSINGFKLTVAKNSGTNNCQFYNLKCEYKEYVTGDPTTKPVYKNNAITATIYNFIAKANEVYASVCGSEGNNQKPDIETWCSVLESDEYKKLVADTDSYNLLKSAICGEGAYGLNGVYVASGEKQSSDMVIEFLQKYDRVVSLYGEDESDYNYLGRSVSSSGSRINPILALNEVDNSVWVISAVALVGLTAIGGYFFYRKRKEI